MKRWILVSILVVCSWVFMGCSVELRDRVRSPELPTEAIQSGDSAADGSESSGPLQVVPLPEPNRYAIQFSGGTAQLYRRQVGPSYYQQSDRPAVVSTPDLTVQAGHIYEYSVSTDFRESWKVKVPADLVIDGEWSPSSELPSGGRMFLSSRARIQLGARSFHWKLRELHAEPGALLISFAQTSTASGAGRSAGTLAIEASLLRGALEVRLHGEDGGPGEEGPAWNSRAPSGTAALGSFDSRLPLCRVDRPSVAGVSGGPGKVGGRGHPGGHGGRLLLISKDHSQLDLKFSAQGGRGGAGGPGGPGQKGGEAPPDHPESARCPELRSAGAGAEGPQGPVGSQGFAGNEGSIHSGLNE